MRASFGPDAHISDRQQVRGMGDVVDGERCRIDGGGGLVHLLCVMRPAGVNRNVGHPSSRREASGSTAARIA